MLGVRVRVSPVLVCTMTPRSAEITSHSCTTHALQNLYRVKVLLAGEMNRERRGGEELKNSQVDTKKKRSKSRCSCG